TVPSPPTAITAAAYRDASFASAVPAPGASVHRNSIWSPDGTASINTRAIVRARVLVAGLAITTTRSPRENECIVSGSSILRPTGTHKHRPALDHRPMHDVVDASGRLFIRPKNLVDNVICQPCRGGRQDQAKDTTHCIL